MHIAAPIIDAMHDLPPQFQAVLNDAQNYHLAERKYLAKDVCEYLNNKKPSSLDKNNFYRSVTEILAKYPRLALYLPFKTLKEAPKEFRPRYLEAWRECWAYRDLREAFNLGDIYESSAAIGESERIVKAMHLVPWLVQYEYLGESDIVTIMRFMHDDNLLCWSLKDAASVMYFIDKLSVKTWKAIKEINIAARTKPPTLIVETAERRHWREARAKNYNFGENFSIKNPTGPFSDNIDYETIGKLEVPDDQILILTGSRLKGYGRNDSDFDIFHYDPIAGVIKEYEAVVDHPAVFAHLILDSAWIGNTERGTQRAQYFAALRYLQLNEEQRRQSLLRMEMDLLQFRLMHKAFPAAHPKDCAQETKTLARIDGASAFYDDRYRAIATQLFAKYIVLP